MSRKKHKKITKRTPIARPITYCTKRNFKNQHDAQKAAEFHMLENMQLELSVYQCDMCQYWHLTST